MTAQIKPLKLSLKTRLKLYAAGHPALVDVLSKTFRDGSRWVVNIFQFMIVSAMITAGTTILAALVFMRPGLPDIIGQIFASQCLGEGRCDFNFLMAGFSGANVLALSFVVTFLFIAFGRFTSPEHVIAFDDEDEEDEAEAETLETIRLRLVAMDLQLANVAEMLSALMPDKAEPADPARLEMVSPNA